MVNDRKAIVVSPCIVSISGEVRVRAIRILNCFGFLLSCQPTLKRESIQKLEKLLMAQLWTIVKVIKKHTTTDVLGMWFVVIHLHDGKLTAKLPPCILRKYHLNLTLVELLLWEFQHNVPAMLDTSHYSRAGGFPLMMLKQCPWV